MCEYKLLWTPQNRSDVTVYERPEMKGEHRVQWLIGSTWGNSHKETRTKHFGIAMRIFFLLSVSQLPWFLQYFSHSITCMKNYSQRTIFRNIDYDDKYLYKTLLLFYSNWLVSHLSWRINFRRQLFSGTVFYSIMFEID